MNASPIFDSVRGSRVLITGGCGFIGAALGRKLTALGAAVTAFDLNPRSVGDGIKIVQGDVTSLEALDKAMRGHDVVFHLSALLGVENILNIPKDVLDVNLGGAIKALEAAVKNRISRFIFTSSSEIYGEPLRLPIHEDDPTAPVSTYGVSKLAAEEYCHSYFLEYGLPTTRVRYFNVYGPGQTERFVVPIFISQIAQGNPPVIFGDGEQIRSYTYVDDAVDGTILAAYSSESIDSVFNIGSDNPLSINDLASFLIDHAGRSELKPVYRKFGDGIRIERREVQKRIPDITKARSVLGYEPKIGWKEGMRAYADWYINQSSSVRSASNS